MSSASSDLFEQRFRQLNNVPTLPHAATRALAIVNDPKCNLRDLGKVIEQDPALAASLLKLVNSSFYAATNKVSNLSIAVTRLGMRETRNLILAVGVRSVFRFMPKEQAAERDRLWKHSGLTAVLCRHLNLKFRLGFQGEEFAAGLSHDLGRIMLAVGYPEAFRTLADRKIINEDILIEQERQMLGFDHTELGAWLTNLWNLPRDLTEAIQFHHSPNQAQEHGKLASLVCLGEAMANYFEETKLVDGCNMTENAGWGELIRLVPSLSNNDPVVITSAILAEATKEFEASASVALNA